MRRVLFVLLAAGGLTISAAPATDDPGKAPEAEKSPAPPSSISDRDLSLYPGSLFEVPDPAVVHWNASSPGDNERLPRAYPIAPPRIPHAIADFLPITLANNGCLDCHALDAGADAPELPPSHRTDLRNAPNVVGTKVAGARFLCITCHVPTSDAPPARTSRLPAP